MRVADDVVLSPKQVEPDSAELNLSELGLTVIAADWGESGVEGSAVRTSIGQQMVDRQPKVTTSILKLAVREDVDVDLPTAAYRLTQKVGEMQRSRRWMRRDFFVGNFAGSLLCMVTGEVTLADIGGWQVGDSPDVTLTLVRNPTWYSTEETESATFKEEVARELIYTLPASKGTAEGLKRIAVKNLGTVDWNGLIWAEECEDYQPGPTAEPAYAAKALTYMGGSASTSTTVSNEFLAAGWLTVLGSEIPGVGHMTHRGARRFWVRASSTGGVDLRVRWRALGSLRWSEENPVVPVPNVGGPLLLDLGECRPQIAALGDERWEWQLLARALGGSGTVFLTRVYPLPTEQFALVRVSEEESTVGTAESTKSPSAVVDDASIGTVTWTNPGNAKASDNARATAGEGITHYLKATGFGFEVPAEATITAIVVGIEKSVAGAGSVTDEAVRLVKGGVIGATDKADTHHPWSEVDQYSFYGGDLWEGAWAPADVNAAGFGAAFAAHVLNFGSISARVDHIKIGIYYTTLASENRVCFAGRSLELRSDGVFRQHREDDVWGSMVPDGFPPVTMPGGLEARPSRGIIIPSQGDLNELPDAGSNKESVVVRTRDGYHLAREAA
jgi:hypothetical protein